MQRFRRSSRACVGDIVIVGELAGSAFRSFRILREPESSTFTDATGSNENVRRLQVAMDDPALVRSFQSRRNLASVFEHRLKRQGTG